MATGKRTLEIIITASAKQAQKVFNKLKTGMRNVVSVGARIGAGLAAGFGVATVAVGVLFTKISALNDNLAKTSDKLGVATEELAALRHGAELAGIGATTLDMGLQRMTRRLAEAAKGGGEAKGAIEELGLSAKGLAKASPDEALRTIIKALEGVEDQSEKVRLAFKFFDSEGVAFVNLTTEAMAEARDEAFQLGLTLRRADAALFVKANDSITKLKSLGQGLVTQFAIKLAPAITVVADKITNFFKAEGGNRLSKIVSNVADGIVNLGATIISSIPKALIVVLNIVHRVGMAFRGWGLLWNELQIGFLSFSEVLWSGLSKVRNGVTALLEATNVGGVFDKQIEESKRIAEEQRLILDTIGKDKAKVLSDQNKAIQKTKEEKAGIEGYKSQVVAISEEFEKFSKAIKGSADAAFAEADAAEAMASSYDKAAEAKRNFLSQKIVRNSSGAFVDARSLTDAARTQGGS